MTIAEAVYKYGLSEYKPSKGDDLIKVCRQLYKSDNEIYRNILKTVNCRFDWSDLEPTSLKFLRKEVADQIDEIW